MRQFIADGAGVDVADLPFAGELMEVRQEFDAQWRGALERLLRGFGLSLLVPEALYSRVNHFINDNDLRGRVVYHRVPNEAPGFQPSHDKGRVIERMRQTNKINAIRQILNIDRCAFVIELTHQLTCHIENRHPLSKGVYDSIAVRQDVQFRFYGVWINRQGLFVVFATHRNDF